jgi:glycosyltransferase involved in cell wall biosynthesis
MPARDGSPLISILMLTYNHERFVAEAVEGALTQTYAPLQIIIMDDCSRDRTAEVIATTLAAHPQGARASFVRNPANMGPFGAARLGLGMVRGDFIVAAAGDDIMRPEMVAQMAKVWIEDGASLVTANAYYIDENSKSLGRTHRDPNGPIDESFETLARDGANACCFGAGMGFDREVHAKFGWPPSYLGTADIILPFWACLLNGARFIQKPLLGYRVHGHNASLSLIAERSDRLNELIAKERMFYLHIAHALFMQEELTRVAAEKPERYAPVAARISPLLAIQVTEMAKKLVRTRAELDELRRTSDGASGRS